MKISKVIFHIKPIPSHPWWECKKCSFTKTMRRVTSRSLPWRNLMNWVSDCFRTHHIHRIWPLATTTCLQTSKKCSNSCHKQEENAPTPTRKSSPKRTLISRPKINRSTRKVLKCYRSAGLIVLLLKETMLMNKVEFCQKNVFFLVSPGAYWSTC